MKIVILTGDQLRHDYFRKIIALNNNIEVLTSYCESNNQLKSSVEKKSSQLQLEHLRIREQSEKDFFEDFVLHSKDLSNPQKVNIGEINNNFVVENIIKLNPDLIISYGCSIITSKLLDVFENKFINLHLGLSPYYRGSGTNYWPFVNSEPEFCGVTFMYIDKGIDTGKIIHQIQADYGKSDHPVVIGNRLIKKMSKVIIELINNFKRVEAKDEILFNGKLYKNKDFSDESIIRYYSNFARTIESLFENKNKHEKIELIQQHFLDK